MKWFHLFMAAMLGVASIRLIFEVGARDGLICLGITYLYWHFTYRRLDRKERTAKANQARLNRFLQENEITPAKMVEGPDLIIAVNSQVNKLFVIGHKGYEFERPLAYTPDGILDIHLTEQTEVRKEEAGGWTSGLIASVIAGSFLGFLLGFIFGRETRTRTIVTGYQIRITVRNAANPVYYLTFKNYDDAEYWQGLLMVMTGWR